MRARISLVVASLLLAVLWAGAQTISNPSKGQAFRGILQTSAGAPVAGVEIELLGWDGAAAGSTVTDSDGSFTFRDVRPALYWIRGSYQGHPFRQAVDFANPMAIRQVVLDPAPPPQRLAAGNPAADVVSLGALEASPAARKKLKQARKALAAHDVARAFELSGAAIAGAPRWAEPYFFRGVLHLAQHEYRSAVRDLNASLANKPQNPMALAALSAAMQNMGQYRLAVTYADYANQLYPSWQAYFSRAQADLALHRPSDAIADAGQALALTPPGPPECHILRANGDLDLRRFPDAARELRIFLGQAPQAPEAAQARHVLAKLQALAARSRGH